MSYRPLHIVEFETDSPRHSTVVVSPGATLLEAALRANLDLTSACSGQSDCLQCVVVILEGQLSPIDPHEIRLLSPEQLASGHRLACRARVYSAITARLVGENGLDAAN